jgi:hypothetical protein
MKSEFTYKGKYTSEIVRSVMDFLTQDIEIRTISRKTGVPETTIRNWKFGYTNVYAKNNLLTNALQKEVKMLIKDSVPMHKIAQNLEIKYDTVRSFVKKNLPRKKYGQIRWSQRMLPDHSKQMSPEFSYILGVLYGDGYFGVGQIGLGTKDKEFCDYFGTILAKWCGKKPAMIQRLMKNKHYYECLLSFKDATEYVLGIVKNRSSVPLQIFNSTNPIILSQFIKGFSDSEGSIVVKRGCALKLPNQNTKLLTQVYDMMVRLGFPKDRLYIRFNQSAPGGDVYEIIISSKEPLLKFYQLIGFTIQRKQERLISYLKKQQIL